MTSEKAKALEVAIGQIDRHFGRGAIMKLGDTIRNARVEAISTGSISLDMALGVGGIPRGRVTEIFGAEASGKSTLAYHVMAEAQRVGGVAAYIDAEHALDPSYSAKCGVNTEELLISQPDTAEQGLEICEYLVRSGAVDVVVVDSVAALVPKAELEGDMGDTHMGLQARLMSQALRKLASAISRSNTAVIFINQIREKIGVFFGNPGSDAGGTRPQVLQLGADRPAQAGVHQAGQRGGGEPGSSTCREEQGGAPIPGHRVRHHVQRGYQQGRRPHRRSH